MTFPAISQPPRDPAFAQDPYAFYARMHATSPVFFWEEYGHWCAADFDTVNRLLRDRRLGRENRWGPPLVDDGSDRRHLMHFDVIEAHSMLEREPPLHTKLRTLVNKAFVSRNVERLRPRIRALAEDLAEGLKPGDDLIAKFATPIPVTVICELLGVPVANGPQLLDWSHRMVAMYMFGRTRADEDSANEAARAFAEFLTGFVDERRAAPGDDLLSLLISARDEGETLTHAELVSSAILLLNAGHEATVHQTGNAIATILAQGGDPRRFFSTPEQTEATAEECLRIDAPLHMFTRYAYETVDIGPAILQPGDRIGLLLAAANRDPAAFEAPHEFRPGRAGQKNVSFGAGIHFCVGAPLARIEVQESLSVLFRRHPDLALAAAPRFRDTYHFHGLERLIVNP
jgi:unspecific monooxygenase